MNQPSPRFVATVLHQHAEEAAFQWLLRSKAVKEPHYSLADLSKLDLRVEAHLDGLWIAQDFAWDICYSQFQDRSEAGELFVCAVLAFGSNKKDRITVVLEAAGTNVTLSNAVVSALGWIGFDCAKPWIYELLNSDSTTLRTIGIAGSSIHRHDPGPLFFNASTIVDPVIHARTLKAIGELRRIDNSELLLSSLDISDQGCVFWAAWALAVLGKKDGIPVLSSIALSVSPLGERASAIAARSMHHRDAQEWFENLTNDHTLMRRSLITAGAIGDPSNMDYIIDCMSIPELSRIAGEAFSMITGVDLDYNDLQRDAPEGFESGPTDDPEDKDITPDPDEELYWPDTDLLQNWWRSHSAQFRRGERYLAGNKITTEWCQQVLCKGMQRQRNAAAFELAQSGHPLFETRAPGFIQAAILDPR